MSIIIPEGSEQEWLSELKPYQRSTVDCFLQNANFEEAAQLWLSTTGSPEIIQFGGEKDPEVFWNRFSQEFFKYICDDSAYKDEKEALYSEARITRDLLIASVSATLGSALGLAATLLAPVIVLMFLHITKIGRNAYCNEN